MSARAGVLKTYKLLINGQFVRSESGRAFEVRTAQGAFLANVAQASRKDLRDAVQAARKAQSSWAQRTAYNRGQILYRIAEMLESRREAFEHEIVLTTGVSASDAEREVDAAIDRWVYYAGWSDKWSALLSTVNPVAMPMHNFTLPEPTGVVGLVCPDAAPLASLTSLLAPVIVSGNTAVVILSERYPTIGLSFAEVLETSDLPAGVVNLLAGFREELLPHLCAHVEVDALNLCGVPEEQRASCEIAAAETVKRLHHSPRLTSAEWCSEQAQGLDWIEPFVEMKTVWHPLGW
ncbi:MAG: aldehyde dehydrogenase family protein [Fimbriimonadales bacterium]|nr:aldehyde dehydrogenase family protein [Fimbriimonadales bacterium]